MAKIISHICIYTEIPFSIVFFLFLKIQYITESSWPTTPRVANNENWPDQN